MAPLNLKWRYFVAGLFALVLIFSFYRFSPAETGGVITEHGSSLLDVDLQADEPLPAQSPFKAADRSKWAELPQQNPLTSFTPLPKIDPSIKIPKIQADFEKLSPEARAVQDERVAAVKSNFTHAWRGYKKHAWLKDEVAPLSGGSHDSFGGWAASLVDALGTLWIMDLTSEFEEAVQAVEHIDFSTCSLEELNVFETAIRYMGGFLSAYDLSEGKYPTLLTKAIELGEMLYHAFDTPNRMPNMRWNFKAALDGRKQTALETTIVAEIGSLTLEFTRLSQLTGDMKYYDAVARVMNVFDGQQAETKLPGMWPLFVNARDEDFTQNGDFTLGGMADSTYEYLPKEHLLLGGASKQYRKMYEDAMKPIMRHIFYRPMTNHTHDLLLAGQVHTDGRQSASQITTEPQAQHLACFVGGMVGLAAKIFNDGRMETAKKLVEGCLWGYESFGLGIFPEIFHTLPCADAKHCPYDESAWHAALESAHPDYPSAREIIKYFHLPPGVVKVDDPRYILRPEAIESVFYAYRLTGDASYRDRAWGMFNSIISATKTEIAHAGLNDCVRPNPPRQDKMESFWFSETLRYFYLIFSDENLVSLDEFVLNTEAHPLKRPEAGVA